MATDYLELNREVLKKLKEEAPVKYRSLKRYLECQNIYAQALEEGVAEGEAWQRAAVHWNEWANKLLEERKKLEDSGQWQIGKDFIVTRKKQQPTWDWLKTAKADFSCLRFFLGRNTNDPIEKGNSDHISIMVMTASFGYFLFPSHTDFHNTIFSGNAFFKKATFEGNSNFQDTIFSETAYFEAVIFNHYANFQGSTFHDGSGFRNVKFNNTATFEKATFRGEADFRDTIFNNSTNFWNATFYGNAYFWHSTFRNSVNFGEIIVWKIANFQKTTFGEEAIFVNSIFKQEVDFQLAQFEKPVFFVGAIFQASADFSFVHSKRGFSLHKARFSVVPDFNEAVFHAPPVLDDMHVDEQLTAKSLTGLFAFRHVPQPTKHAKRISRNFRALGKMAHEARDWLNEMEFFAQESRSRRFGLDFPFGKNMGRFWVGMIYEKFSDFGRSFARPLAAWGTSIFVFASIYWMKAIGGTFSDAFTLSWRQGLITPGLLQSSQYEQLLTRLFDKNPGNGVFELSNGIYVLTGIQTMLSAFFLFFFFLAVRNHFRIR